MSSYAARLPDMDVIIRWAIAVSAGEETIKLCHRSDP